MRTVNYMTESRQKRQTQTKTPNDERSALIAKLKTWADTIEPLHDGGSYIGETYKLLGRIGEHLDRLENELWGISGVRQDREISQAYHAYSQARRRVVAALSQPKYRQEIEETLRVAARAAGVDTGNKQMVVWYLDGCHRRGEHDVELATYLTGSQLGTRYYHEVMYHSYIPPTYVRAEILVRTPAWVAEYARACEPEAAQDCSETHVLDENECDYLRGLWRGRREDLEKVVSAAKTLHRVSVKRVRDQPNKSSEAGVNIGRETKGPST